MSLLPCVCVRVDWVDDGFFFLEEERGLSTMRREEKRKRDDLILYANLV